MELINSEHVLLLLIQLAAHLSLSLSLSLSLFPRSPSAFHHTVFNLLLNGR